MANAALKTRGSLLIWLDKEMTWLAAHEGRPGRPAIFSDAAIQFCPLPGRRLCRREGAIKVLFKLPLRQTTGMVASLLRMSIDWPVPDYSTLCRRQKTLAAQIPYRRSDGPLNLLVPSLRHSRLPGGGQHRHQVLGRWDPFGRLLCNALPASGCGASKHSANASWRETRTDKPPKSTSASH